MKGISASKIISSGLKIILPLFAAGMILWWMYRDFDWEELRRALSYEMNWTWMWLSMPFGVLAQVFRALRWRQTLVPLGERPRVHTCINAIFMSYASSLVVPRVGEVLRCGLLRRYEQTPFTKALGTVVTERMVDSILILLLAMISVLLQIKVFMVFFAETGVSIEGLFGRFTMAGFWVTVASILAILVLVLILAYKLAWFSKTKNLFRDILDGILSLRKLKNIPLYLFYSIGIWVAYFLHFYLTFYSFTFTSGLGASAALVAFIVGCFAVLVPTPNGAGPWHFAVKTVLVLYGVAAQQGVMFVLVVHTLQTLLVLLLGVYALLAFVWTRPKEKHEANMIES